MTQQNHVYIDPRVGYCVAVYEHTPKDKPTVYSVSANVVLEDCSHKMGWGFGAGDIDKIDAAIGMLTEFRKKFLETEKLVAKLNK